MPVARHRPAGAVAMLRPVGGGARAIGSVRHGRRLVSEPLVAAAPAAWIDDGRLPVEDGVLSPDALLGAPLILFPRTVARPSTTW
jgi:hypothetical protein